MPRVNDDINRQVDADQERAMEKIYRSTVPARKVGLERGQAVGNVIPKRKPHDNDPKPHEHGEDKKS